MNLSVLSRAGKADVRTDPFPHLVIENALAPDIYEAFEREFPAREFFAGDKEQALANTKYLRTGAECLASPDVSPLWKDFVRYHVSPAFFAEVVALFGPELSRLYPHVEEALGKPFADFTAGPREDRMRVPSMSHPYDVMLDCQPALDYTFTERRFRGPHVDSPVEFFAGLLYMRAPEDDSTGGSIALWRAKDEASAFPKERTIRFEGRKSLMDPSALEQVAQVPYRANSLVFFINSWRSLHCAQTRSASVLPRRAVNVIGEICRFPEPGLFTIEMPNAPAKAPPPSLARRLLRRAGF